MATTATGEALMAPGATDGAAKVIIGATTIITMDTEWQNSSFWEAL
eukprot:CAMPEP_0202957214 /NCGR_PEP_ID=MMETSP1396-20130829/1650_1 /ASSEMBLY_ACC=CAM_ASM_000872 /TAXON_ID= /ORGANISM="Pseudokeronopsis sp., Strain Brazil" /LENGTH=45 /DNA_ID= /DNA_START= /DNA_END= /DNA_ORIENTATION=